MTTEIAKRTETFSLAPRNMAEAMQLAEIIAKSDFCPKEHRGKPGNVLIAVQMGAELGLAPMQALQNVSVINGRPAVWGDAMLAIVRAHPQCEGVEESYADGVATCTVRRRGQAPIVSTFSEDDAKLAKLWGKQGPWQQYPRRMLQMRARGFALRDSFADALKGLISAEEARDIPVDVTPRNIGGNGGNGGFGFEAPKPAAAPEPEPSAAKVTFGPAPKSAEEVLEEIQSATTREQLSKVAKAASGLSGSDKARARIAYARRMSDLVAAERDVEPLPVHVVEQPKAESAQDDVYVVVKPKAEDCEKIKAFMMSSGMPENAWGGHILAALANDTIDNEDDLACMKQYALKWVRELVAIQGEQQNGKVA